MRKVISREKAIKIMSEAGKPPLRSKILSLSEALGKRSASNLKAPFDLPPLSRSTRDGYAVNHRDLKGVSEGMPAYLNLIGEIRVGELPNISISLGEAVRVFTGSYLPQGADAVVMNEFVEESQGVIEVYRSVAAGENVLAKGEDWPQGSTILDYGERINLGKVGLLAAYGFDKVEVIELRVGIASTGDEVVSPGNELPAGKIYDINSYTLYSLLKNWGAEPWIYGVVSDNLDKLVEVLDFLLDKSDVVVLSGGSSIGVRDYTRELFRKLKGDLLIEGLNISPGKPTVAGWIRGKPVFGLPGHPISSIVSARVFMIPALESMLGVANQEEPFFIRIGTNLPSVLGVEEFICACLGDKCILPIWGKSGAISRVARGNFLIRVPEDVEGYREGEVVEVWSI